MKKICLALIVIFLVNQLSYSIGSFPKLRLGKIIVASSFVISLVVANRLKQEEINSHTFNKKPRYGAKEFKNTSRIEIINVSSKIPYCYHCKQYLDPESKFCLKCLNQCNSLEKSGIPSEMTSEESFWQR